MIKKKIFYFENNETHIATGEILTEDADFLVVQDRIDGVIKLGKKFIIKIKDVIDDGNNTRP